MINNNYKIDLKNKLSVNKYKNFKYKKSKPW
jgi:hypothetical protein